MAYMRNTQTLASLGPITDDSPEYMYLQTLKDPNGRPLYEQVSAQDAAVVGAKQPVSVQSLFPATAAGADTLQVVGRAPFAGFVNKVEYIPQAAVVGAVTNSRTLNAINGGQAGAGATNVAALALVTGVNLTINASNPLTLSVVANALVVAANDEIEFQSLHIGTGIADPGGLVVVSFTRE